MDCWLSYIDIELTTKIILLARTAGLLPAAPEAAILADEPNIPFTRLPMTR